MKHESDIRRQLDEIGFVGGPISDSYIFIE